MQEFALALATIAAIIAGPSVALKLQRRSERRRDRRNRKLVIFKELMATRATRVSRRHVDALNAIEVEFSGASGDDKRVLEAWKLYLDHLSDAQMGKSDNQRWADKGNDLLVDLLNEMSRALNYDFDKVALKKNIYSPQAHTELDADQYLLRKFAVEVIAGKRAILVGVDTSEKPLDVKLVDENHHISSPPYIPDPLSLPGLNDD